MQIVRRRTDPQSLVSSQVGLIFGIVVGFAFLRGTHHLAHFWPITLTLAIVYESTLLLRIKRS